MRKELLYNLSGTTVHIYKANGYRVVMERNIDVYGFARKGVKTTGAIYRIFFVLNFLGIGIAISDYNKATNKHSK